MTNVPPQTPETNVFAWSLASRFGHVASKGQRENMQVNSMILHVCDAIVAESIHKVMMPLNAVALHLLQMGGLPLRFTTLGFPP